MKPETAEYVSQQLEWAKRCGLKRGDKVLVLADAVDGQGGWKDQMQQHPEVGKEYYILWEGKKECRPEWGLGLHRTRSSAMNGGCGEAGFAPFFVLVKL